MARTNEFIKYITKEGKTKSWEEIADEFKFSSGEAARKFYYRFRKREEKVDFKIKRIKEWQIQTKAGEVKTLTSYEYKSEHDEADYKESFLDFLKDSTKTLPFVRKKQQKDGNTLIISLSDLHIDKFSETSETRERASSELQMSRALDAIDDIVTRSLMTSDLKKIILIGGNDFFHTNNEQNTTVKGTPVESTERWHKSFKKGLMLMKQIIDYCASICQVDYYTVIGNHSAAREVYMGYALEAYYSKNDNVNVLTNVASRSYINVGNSAFMLTHEVNNRAMKNLPVIFITEEPKLYSSCKYRYVLTGHLHKNSETHFMGTNEEFGLTFKIMPSLSNTDKWHFDNLYIGNQKSCIGLVIHNNYGLIDEIIYNE